MEPPSSETSSGSAPASSSACHGRSSSTCSTPSVASTATFIPSSSPAMGRPLPVARTGHTPAHYGFDVHVRPATELRRLLGERLPGRVLSRPLAPAELVRVAGTLVDEGCRVGLERVPGPDLAGDLEALVRQVSAAGLADACELTIPVGLLGRDTAVGIGRLAADVGVAVLLGGPAPDGHL